MKWTHEVGPRAYLVVLLIDWITYKDASVSLVDAMESESGLFTLSFGLNLYLRRNLLYVLLLVTVSSLAVMIDYTLCTSSFTCPNIIIQ